MLGAKLASRFAHKLFNSFTLSDGLGSRYEVEGLHLRSATTSQILETAPVTNNSVCALGKEIRHQRRLAGLSQKEVAARIGVTGVQLHRYEVGATGVTTSRLVDIASAIGVRPDILLNAATKSAQAPAATNDRAGPAGDVATFLEMFMTIQDPAHRDALMAVARMMSSTFQQSTPPYANSLHGQDHPVSAIAA